MRQPTIEVNSQIVHKSKQRMLGNNQTVIRYGSVISIDAEGEMAEVFFTNDRIRKRIPVSELELASSVNSGRARVQTNPMFRGNLIPYVR